MPGKVTRITLFKIADPKDVDAALEAYKALAKDNSKDGSNYILSCQAYKLYPDPRSKGFTLAANTVFSSLEDMKYYDDECAAHKTLKGVLGPKVADPKPENMMTIYADA